MTTNATIIQAVEDQIVGTELQRLIDVEASAARFAEMADAAVAAEGIDPTSDYAKDIREDVWDRGDFYVELIGAA